MESLQGDKLKGFVEKAQPKPKVNFLAECSLCNSDNDVLMCGSGHRDLDDKPIMFCRKCLKETKEVGANGREFIAKCDKFGACNYYPIKPWDVDTEAF